MSNEKETREGERERTKIDKTTEMPVKEFAEISTALKELSQSLSQTTKSLMLPLQLQLCRDLEVHTKVAYELSRAIKYYLESSFSMLEKHIVRYIEAMKKADDTLNNVLENLFNELNTLTNKIKLLTGIESGAYNNALGVAKLLSLNIEAYGISAKMIEEKKAVFTKLYEDFETRFSQLTSSIERLEGILFRYSIKTPVGHPFIIGIPVIAVRVNDTVKTSVLGEGLNKYHEKVKTYVTLNRELSVDSELYEIVIDNIRRRKSLLYKLFLKSVTR